MSEYRTLSYSAIARDTDGQIVRPLFKTEMVGTVENISDDVLTFLVEKAAFDRDEFYTLVESGTLEPGAKLNIGSGEDFEIPAADIACVLRFRLFDQEEGTEGVLFDLEQEEGPPVCTDIPNEASECLYQCEVGCESMCENICQTGDEVTAGGTGGLSGRVLIATIVGSAGLGNQHGGYITKITKFTGIQLEAQDGPTGDDLEVTMLVNAVMQAAYTGTLDADSQTPGEEQISTETFASTLEVSEDDNLSIEVTNVGSGDPGGNINIYLTY